MPPITRHVQSSHAAIEAARFIPPFSEHPHLVVIGLPDERSLRAAVDRIRTLGVLVAVWCEPDLGGALTAFATEPVVADQRIHFKRYRLLTGEKPREVGLRDRLRSFFRRTCP